jgi:hypothetical protein
MSLYKLFPFASKRATRFATGTDGSNPLPSSGQSVSLPQPLSSVENPARPFVVNIAKFRVAPEAASFQSMTRMKSDG